MIDSERARERALAASDEWHRRHKMEDWQNSANSPRIQAVQRILAELEQNDSAYLTGEINREKWIEVGKSADDRLAVAGLRLASRPWAR